MRRPLRRFCFMLAEKLHMSVKRLIEEVDAAEFYEWMAYHLTQDEEFSKKVTRELEMEKQAAMSPKEQALMLTNMFKAKIKNGNSK